MNDRGQPEVRTTAILEDLRTSPTNPRRRIDKAALAELTASVCEVGILQPLIVRKVGKDFEIVCGHRRAAAAKAAGLTAVPVVVKDLTDEQAQVVQLIENLQREDLGPLEEAEGYDALRRAGKSIEEIAAGTHKSRATVLGRLKLLALPAAAQKALLGGLLPLSIASLIARIPNDELREQAAKQIIAGRYGRPYGFRDAQELIRQDFMTDLGSAPFPVKNETLVPEAGSCLDCPERTGNNLDLFGDVAAEKKGKDVCTNPTCFRAKVKAWADLQVELAAANGQKVLSAKDVKKVWPRGGGHTDYSSPYVALDDECYQDSKDRRYKTLLGSDAPEAILAIDPDGRPRQLVPRAEAEAILAKKHDWARPRSSSGRQGKSAADKKRAAEAEHRRQVNTRIMEELVAVAEGQAFRTPSAEAWAVIARAAIHRAWNESLKDVCRRRGWLEEKPAKGKGRKPSLKSAQDILLQKLAALNGAQARGLAIEVILAPFVGLPMPGSVYQRTGTTEPALKAFGLDLKATQESVRAKAQAAKTEKPARKRSKKAAAEGEA